MKQSHVVEKLRQVLGNNNVECIVASRGNKKGRPDVLVSRKGLASFVEIKIDDDELSPLQEKFLKSNYLNSVSLHAKASEKIRDAHEWTVSKWDQTINDWDSATYISKDLKFIVKHL